MRTLAVALDGEKEPTLWLFDGLDDPRPTALVRRCDLPEKSRAEGWEHLTAPALDLTAVLS